MTAAAPAHSFGEIVVDVVYRPDRTARPPVAAMSKPQKAGALQWVQQRRAMLAAEEAELILGLAADTPDDDDPLPEHPGAKKDAWASDPEFPGVSEFFPAELAMVLNVGRGTASFRARRAFVWREKLPLTYAALRRGEIDERRAQELFDVFEHVDPALARNIEAALLLEATDLSVSKLGKRARELLFELDPDTADQRREQAQKASDVFVQPKDDGMATLGADLPVDEAAEAYNLIDELAKLAKADGDERPIRQIRTEIYSLLLRRPGSALPGVRAHLTITAALEALEGTSTQPGDVDGFAITPAQLRELLQRIGALGLETPGDGSLMFAITDEHGRLIATVSLADLQKLTRRGEGLNPPPATDAYTPTDKQRVFITTRDRTCRFPNCGQRVGWADHDHVIPHACGGETTCTNLCCLCRSHHRLKTFARGWSFVMDDDGTLHVTTPSGITRTRRPPGLRRPPPEPPPPDPATDLPPF